MLVPTLKVAVPLSASGATSASVQLSGASPVASVANTFGISCVYSEERCSHASSAACSAIRAWDTASSCIDCAWSWLVVKGSPRSRPPTNLGE